MINHTIVGKWVTAIIRLFATDRAYLSTVREQAVLINRILGTTVTKQFLVNASVAPALRKQLITDYLAAHLDIKLVHALYLLVDYNLFSIVDKIMDELIAQIDTLQGQIRGYIYSYIPLQASQLKRIEQKLTQNWQKKVILTPRIDQSLLGGVKIVTHFRVIDESVLGRLQEMQHKILQLKSG